MIYQDRFEFPEKRFYWCNRATGMKFQRFPALNTQHTAKVDEMANQPFSGEWDYIIEKCEDPEELEAIKQRQAERESRERDPLESTEEEDPALKSIKINFKEIDRVHYHVLAIENDCHIVPAGSMKMNIKHELQRNEAFLGLDKSTNFHIQSYSHFRQVQSVEKRNKLEDDEIIFSKDFLDNAYDGGVTPEGMWSVQTS